MENLLSHPLFEKYPPTEMHKEDIDRLIACYPDGLEQIKKKTRAENQNLANPTKPTQIVIAESSNKRQFDLNDPCSPETTELRLKKRKTTGSRHHTTKDETDIFTVLKVYKDKLLDDTIANICEYLSNVWTIKKVRKWWYNHKDK
ncbi:hypothetical protein RclHR1_02410002 [Rhizophagus clarus]|uniref:Uncharacterized protein n=1 Tax=Rhizophagus clarus TaxID=94130 RepID=A0A2Z6RRD3_9GLOM|nr:hypothetical protein RclHR1_02410002 [Rhizophagus clarus]GET00550.1 hypothetical protein GLOIN_2v1482460 [Rhizophagus clarus]